ncbi:MAG: hypothetical protein WAN60_08450, partial [Candidatus Sulfotelmatobacter sp.]
MFFLLDNELPGGLILKRFNFASKVFSNWRAALADAQVACTNRRGVRDDGWRFEMRRARVRCFQILRGDYEVATRIVVCP